MTDAVTETEGSHTKCASLKNYALFSISSIPALNALLHEVDEATVIAFNVKLVFCFNLQNISAISRYLTEAQSRVHCPYLLAHFILFATFTLL